MHKRIICLHSVLSRIAVPYGSVWQDRNEYVESLRVEPDWFYEFVDQAEKYWGKENLAITFDDGFMDNLVPAVHCALRGIETWVFVPFQHVGKLVPGTPLPMLGWKELEFLSWSGVGIGSHGCTHLEWSTLSARGVRDEISASLEACKKLQKLSKKKYPLSIAPPHGTYTRDQYKEALDIGFQEVYGTVKSPAGTFGVRRLLGNCWGFVEEDSTKYEEHPWPWE